MSVICLICMDLWDTHAGMQLRPLDHYGTRELQRVGVWYGGSGWKSTVSDSCGANPRDFTRFKLCAEMVCNILSQHCCFFFCRFQPAKSFQKWSNLGSCLICLLKSLYKKLYKLNSSLSCLSCLAVKSPENLALYGQVYAKHPLPTKCEKVITLAVIWEVGWGHAS